MKAHVLYRFLLGRAFNLPNNARHELRRMQCSREAIMMNYGDVEHLLADV